MTLNICSNLYWWSDYGVMKMCTLMLETELIYIHVGIAVVNCYTEETATSEPVHIVPITLLLRVLCVVFSFGLGPFTLSTIILEFVGCNT